MGAIQGAINKMIGTATAVAVAGKKASENERQAREEASAKAEAKAKAESDKAQAEAKAKQAQVEQEKALQEEAQASTLEADLIKQGADPEKAKAFMDARALGLSTKGFGMIRGEKGKFKGSYSKIAEQLAKGALADSLTARVINEEGFAQRVMALGGTRKGRVQALVQASGGSK